MGILFPFLFSLFINDLIVALEWNNEGRFVTHMFCECVAHADDIVLLAPLL